MCGISIIIDRCNKSIDDSSIQSINEKISHRGPDDAGYYFGTNFAFGHRRLSILDLSSAGHQPMQRDHLCISYNGEIYNYIELRQELKELGHSFISGSDTEVILTAYRQWGDECFSRFNGMWALAIHDSIRNEIIFCRDHFGIKPLYYTLTKGFFLAGSEIKQFTAIDEFKASLNKVVAANFLTYGLLNYSEETFFENVKELRGGHYLRYNLSTHQFSLAQWYNLSNAAIPIADSYEQARQKVRSLFVDSVKLRMRSDVRVGSCLSGGIDSSSIVSIIHSQKLANPDFATITSCYENKKFDEQIFSDLVTESTKFSSKKVFPILNDLLDKGHLDKIIYHQDQPFSGASHYSEYKVFEEASKNKLIVMQDGQGSDEYLCGYGEFYVAGIAELLLSFRFRKAFLFFKTKAVQKRISVSKEVTQFLFSFFIHDLIKSIKLVFGKGNPSWLTPQWHALAGKSLKTPLKNIRDLSICEIETLSIPYQLHSEDRNSMLFSIESRLPFLDHRLVEYCIGLPSLYKISPEYTKAILRDAIGELPEPIKNRKDKMGFVAPDAEWMLKNHKRIKEELRTIVRKSEIFSDQLLVAFDKFVEGKRIYDPIFFRALSLSRFCSLFNMKLK